MCCVTLFTLVIIFDVYIYIVLFYIDSGYVNISENIDSWYNIDCNNNIICDCLICNTPKKRKYTIRLAYEIETEGEGGYNYKDSLWFRIKGNIDNYNKKWTEWFKVDYITLLNISLYSNQGDTEHTTSSIYIYNFTFTVNNIGNIPNIIQILSNTQSYDLTIC